MTNETKRGIKEGIGFGIIAGAIFALFSVIMALAAGMPAVTPFRMFASIILGGAAMETVGALSAFLVGAVIHVILSAAFGLVYGVVNSKFDTPTQVRWGRQAAIGLIYGVLLWFVNFQIIARLVFPWFLEANQFAQALGHAIFFGLPLALMYAAAERRVRHLPAPSPASA